MSNEELESIIKDLISLRASSRLNSEEKKVAENLFRALKEKFGFSDGKIEELLGGTWKFPTIKSYTRGVKTKSTMIPKATSDTFSQMIARGLDLDKVKVAIQIQSVLDEQGVTLEDASRLISMSRNAGMSLDALVSTVKEVEDAGIPIRKLGQTIEDLKSLEAKNINNRNLEKLAEAARKIGNFDNIMEAIAAFDQLEKIKVELQVKTSERQALDEDVRSLNSGKQAIQPALDLYQQLRQKGFSQEILAKIMAASAKYGEPALVFEALEQYGSLLDLAEEFDTKNFEVDEMQEKLSTLLAKYQHLSEVTAMCDELLKRKFNITSIQEITDIAVQYGEPAEVLKAIRKHGKIPELEAQISRLEQDNRRLEQKSHDYDEIKRQKEIAEKNSTTVEQKALKIIDELSQELQKPAKVRDYRKGLIDSGLPARLEEIVENLASKRVIAAQNAELIAIFRDEVNRQLSELSEAWPSRLGISTREKKRKLQDKALANPFVVLKDDWDIPCDICGEMFPHKLSLKSSEDIQRLLMTSGYISVPASFIEGLASGPHCARVSRAGVIRLYLEKGI